ncbi:MAG: hypothetical protein CL908_10445 [Deltaproteobacteria bacterium]|nr:hypothetical protein [Deltaproteobacteria bacterium]
MTTSIASDYLQLVEAIGQRLDVPKIKSVHVAPFDPDPRNNSKFGAIVLSDGTVGITYTGLDDALGDLQVPSRTQDLPGQSPLQVAQLYCGESGWQRSLGMAAINAISQFVLRESGYSPPGMGKTLAQLALKKGDHLGLVGYFPPLVEQARADGIHLTVLELDDRWLQESDEFVVTLDPKDLGTCNKLVCTGTALINQTIDSVLPYCRSAEHKLIVGPTVGCLPDPLFDRGLTALGGCRVVDLEKFLRLWAGQQKWRGATRRYELSRRTGYPGVEALLSAAGTRRGP